MKAIVIREPGDETVLGLGEVPAPELPAGALRIRVAAAGVNRADLMQRQGHYPAPPGASVLLGLECAGEVVEAAPEVTGWKPGDRVMALLAGGGYAEEVVVDAGSALHVPEGMDLEEAAGFPEVFLTVFLNCFQIGGLDKGNALLVHGGGSGIGTASIQLMREAGVTCFVTAGSEAKLQRCRQLGADYAISYRDDPAHLQRGKARRRARLERLAEISQINTIYEEFHIPKWEVETDRGPRTFRRTSPPR